MAIGPVKFAVTKRGQAYVDEPVYHQPLERSRLAAAVASAVAETQPIRTGNPLFRTVERAVPVPPPQPLFAGFNRVPLIWKHPSKSHDRKR